MCYREDLYATCLDDSVRNGSEAVADANKALKIAESSDLLNGAWQQSKLNGVLAASYAEIGDFARATEIEESSIEFATTKKANRLINKDLEKYRNQIPIRCAWSTVC